jgi:hypothetical protein
MTLTQAGQPRFWAQSFCLINLPPIMMSGIKRLLVKQRDVAQRIAIHHDEIGCLVGCDEADIIGEVEQLRVDGRGLAEKRDSLAAARSRIT